MDKSKYNQHIAECKALRAAYSDAGVDMFVRITQFEDDETAWKKGIDGPTGYPTFGDALTEAALVTFNRYERFKLAVIVCGGIEQVRAMGLDAAFEVLSIPNDTVPSREVPSMSARSAAIVEMVAYRKRNNTEPSSHNASSIVRRHFVPEPKPAPVENAFDRLKKDNAALRRQVKALEKGKKELEKENTILKYKLEQYERPGDRKVQRAARKASTVQ